VSVTYIQQPDVYTSGFDPLIFLASSNQSLQTNFRYRVNINDENGNVISVFRIPPYYSDGTVLFDAHLTIENYLSYDILNLINGTVGFQTGINTFCKFTINIAEEYGTPINSYASATSQVIYAINSAQNYLDMINNPIYDRVWFAAGVQAATWLTNQPSTIKIRTGDSYELGFIAGSQFGSPDHLRVKTYDVSGNLLKSSEFDNSQKANTTDDQRFLSVLVGADNINDWAVSAGSAQPLIADNVSYYEISLESSLDVTVSNVLTFEIDRDCTRDNTYQRLFWLNPLGRFDAFNFTQMKTDSITTEKSTYGKVKGVRTSSSFVFNTYQNERSTFFAKSKQRYTLRSGFVNTETATWLKELIQSPLVYMIIDNQFVGVNLITNSYTAQTTLQEKLFNIEIEVELSVDNQRQRL